MRSFDRLTPRGRLRRLRTLALEACDRYGYRALSCSLVAESFNAIFRIDTEDGSRVALRVGASQRIHAVGSEGTEANWLEALRGKQTVRVARVIAATDGALVVEAGSPGVPETRMCVSFEWVPGTTMDERMTLDRVRTMGRLSALLHEHGAAHAPAAAPKALVADRVLYWRNEPRLDELVSPYGTLFSEAADRAQRAIDRLWRHPPHAPHLLHGDLVPANVIVSRGVFTVIDFQDLFWGFELQDVAITIADLQRNEDPELLVEAFTEGYEEVRAWPDCDAETLAALIAARRLHQLNLGLNVRKPGLERFIDAHAELIAASMRAQTG